MELFAEFAYHQVGRLSLVQHRHSNLDQYEVIQVLSGGGNALLFDHTCPLQNGTLLFIDAGCIHAINPDDLAMYCRNKLIVEKAFLRQLFASIHAEAVLHELFDRHGGSCLYPGEKTSKEIDALFFRMNEELQNENEADRNLRIVSSLLRMITILPQNREETLPVPQDRLAPVLHYLRAHCQEALSVEKIAADTHFNKFYLCHFFREETGLTLMQYLYEQRFFLARQQLSDSKLSVAEIAQNCGFGSSSHFCTYFRRHEGMSPREYRRKFRGD